MSVRTSVADSIKEKGSCYRCGRFHSSSVCRFKEAKCHNCGKIGHIKVVCRSAPKNATDSQRNVAEPRNSSRLKLLSEETQSGNEESDHSEFDEYTMFNLNRVHREPPLLISITLDSRLSSMEVDTGASLSVMSLSTFRGLWPQRELLSSSVILRTYSGEKIPVKGRVDVVVNYENQKFELPLYVVDGGGPTLLGRNWIKVIRLNWCALYSI